MGQLIYNLTSAINTTQSQRERLDGVKILEAIISSLDGQKEDGGKEESCAGNS